MLILVNVVDNRYHILDTDDMMIEALSYLSLVRAISVGIKIDNLDSSLVQQIKNMPSQRSGWSYDCAIQNNKFYYGTIGQKLIEKPVCIESDGFIAFLKTKNGRDSLEGAVCIGSCMFTIEMSGARVRVNGVNVDKSPQYAFEYMGWYNNHFIIQFEQGVVLFEKGMCYFANTLSKRAKMYQVVRCGYGEIKEIKKKIVVGW